MSIASEITSMGENLKKDYQSIANLGADLTNVDKNIENIAELLDGVYDVLPKIEFQEGTEVTIEGGLKGKLDFDDGKVGFGQASQESTQGYNLCEAKMASDTKYGVTFTNNGDGTFTLNGTNTYAGNITFRIDQSTSGSADNLKNYENGNYTLDLGVQNEYIAYIGITLMQNSTWHVFLTTGGNRRMVSASITDVTNAFIYVYIAQNATLNNVVIKPMLVKGSYTESTIPPFEQYTGGQASPSPNWEQEVKCVAGRNLLNKDKMKYGTISTTDGTTIGTSDSVLYLDDYIPVQPNTSYAISNEYTSSLCRLYYYDSGKNYINTEVKDNVFTTLANAYYIRIQCLHLVNDDLQIEEGSTATPYLPYNTIEIVESGKNLFEPVISVDGTQIIGNNMSNLGVTDGEFSFTANGADAYFGQVLASGSTYTANRGIKIYKNGNEKISYKISNTEINRMFITAYDSNGISLGYTEKSGSSLGTYTFPTNCEFVTFRIGKGNAVSGTIYKFNVMVAYGDEIPDYEPYHTPITYPISLGNNKFYNIGTYRDYILRTTGKNLLNPSQYLNAVVNDTSIGATGTISAWATSWTTWIEMKPNQTYVFSGNLSNVNSNVVRTFVTNSEVAIGTSVTRVNNLSNGGTYTNTGGYKYLVLEFLDVTAFEGNWQIEEGSTASDYQPYGVGNWYKFEKIGFYKITGQETIDEDSVNDRFAFNNLVDILHLQARQQTYCNRFQYISSGNADYGMFAYWNGAITQVFIYDKDYTDPDDLKNYFANNETYFCYIRNTPVLTPITGDLATQLEAFWNAQSNNGTTIITSNGDLPLVLKVRGLKGE